MLIFSPTTEITMPVAAGMPIYRGSSNKGEFAKAIAPENPLSINIGSPSEIVNMIFDKQKPQKHILELEKLGHFVSFSLKKEMACYYATNGYKGVGYMVTILFPEIARGITIMGEGPYIYECNDGSVWLDLRHISIQWIRAASRTRVDHELLLLKGRIHVSRPKQVKPEECNQTFLPWAKTGKRIVIEQ